MHACLVKRQPDKQCACMQAHQQHVHDDLLTAAFFRAWMCALRVWLPPNNRTCVWQKLPEGWLEFHDSITQQPYYYNPNTRQKTWARPVEQSGDGVKVTATRLMSMEQPKSLQPSLNKRRSGSLAGGNNAANSSCSALSGKDGVGPLTSPSDGAAACTANTTLDAAAAAAIAATQMQQQQQAHEAAVQPAAGS